MVLAEVRVAIREAKARAGVVIVSRTAPLAALHEIERGGSREGGGGAAVIEKLSF